MKSPACTACRRRKSRCKIDSFSPTTCLMCRTHGTACAFAPPGRRSRSGAAASSPARPARRATASQLSDNETTQTGTLAVSASARVTVEASPSASTAIDYDAEGQNARSQRLLGPIHDSDSRVLSDLVTGSFGGRSIARTLWTRHASGLSASVTFSDTRRRPLGVGQSRTTAQVKLETIEHLVGPHSTRLMDLFLTKTNTCLPLLDGNRFLEQFRSQSLRKQIPAAFMACIYANSMTYWAADPTLASQHRPDQRFIWNLANEALYEELRLGPNIQTIAAVLLNVGGRPTSLVFNNVGQLGFALSVAFTLGLNRDPSGWDIPHAEKAFRVRLWLSLVLHDRWSSLAYGTPPRIRPGQTDILASSLQSIGMKDADASTSGQHDALRIMISLVELSNVLFEYLDQLHRVSLAPGVESATRNRLQTWAESTTGVTRSTVHRGTDLSPPGAANLRLAYLFVRFLDCRIQLETTRHMSEETMTEGLAGPYLATRRAAEDVVMFLSELGTVQLHDFWLPQLGFSLSTIMSFLLRSALDTSDAMAGLPQNSSLGLAEAMLKSLRSHKSDADWDIGDLCISQYSDAMDRIRGLHLDASVETVDFEMLENIFADPYFQDSLVVPGN